jgi:tRNA/rRNA methyltransferase
VHRVAIELINPDETDVIATDRAARQAWLEARGYRVLHMQAASVESDVAPELDRLQSSVNEDR